jgi:hypothetical protein
MATHLTKGLVMMGICGVLALPGAIQLSRAGQVGYPNAPKVDVTVKNVYSDEDGNSIEIVGVASISADDVKCWDYTGTLSPELSEIVKNKCLRSSSSELSFRFGKKNRFILFRAKPQGRNVEWRQVSGDYVNNSSFYDGSQDSLQLIRVALDKNDLTLSLVANLTAPQPTKVDLPFKLGAKAKVSDSEYEVGPYQPYKIPAPGSNPNSYNERRYQAASKYWTTIFKFTGSFGPGYMGQSMAIFGADKQPILYVDRNGNPVSAVTYLSDPEPEREYYDSNAAAAAAAKDKKPHKYVKSMFVSLQSIQGAMSFVTNVDPAKIGSLQISYSERKTVKFENIPMDPKN